MSSGIENLVETSKFPLADFYTHEEVEEQTQLFLKLGFFSY